MVKRNLQYDESGKQFIYVVLSFLAILISVVTIVCHPYLVNYKRAEACECLMCKAKNLSYNKSNARLKKRLIKLLAWLILGSGWFSLLVLAIHVSCLETDTAQILNPYEVLKVLPNASQSEIRRRFRNLTLIHHPDKESGNMTLFLKVVEAYQALTNEQAMANLEKYGNIDGIVSLTFGIAFPAWLIDEKYSFWVLGSYFILLIVFPTAFFIYWYQKAKYSPDDILPDTLQLFHHYCAKESSYMSKKRLLHILCASFEFHISCNRRISKICDVQEELARLLKKLGSIGEKNREVILSNPYSIKARAIVNAHLLRTPLHDLLENDREIILRHFPKLIKEFANCLVPWTANVPHVLTNIENVLKLCPMIIQGIDNQSLLLQLPHVTQENVSKRPFTKMKHLAILPHTELRQIFQKLDDDQFADLKYVLGNLPLVTMNMDYHVIDCKSNKIYVRDVVTLNIKLKRVNLGTVFTCDEPKPQVKELEKEQKFKRPKKSVRKLKHKRKKIKCENRDTQKEECKKSEEDIGVLNIDKNEDSSSEDIWTPTNPLPSSQPIVNDTPRYIHCPLFPGDVQEYWWLLVCDRKRSILITRPHLVTELFDEKHIVLRFHAPETPGAYSFTVSLKSGTYLGVDQAMDFKILVETGVDFELSFSQSSTEEIITTDED